uniref:Uncharacterized protein n=1 Tax=Picea glauca TaxID=3330 RepID=A0A124GNU9_PICGL|nr:hypothetical protein ABT39_MTgene3184 [Picea glauca]
MLELCLLINSTTSVYASCVYASHSSHALLMVTNEVVGLAHSQVWILGWLGGWLTLG